VPFGMPLHHWTGASVYSSHSLSKAWTASPCKGKSTKSGAGESLSDLTLSTSYTPPLSSPWDPVQMAAHHWAAALRPEQMEAMCRK
jgi:hypothetical protein